MPQFLFISLFAIACMVIGLTYNSHGFMVGSMVCMLFGGAAAAIR